MEYKLIMAVSGFPSLYDTGSLTYRDLNMRSDAWRHVAEIVGVPESECRRKWKTLRDQHRRERQRERERRESGVGLFNYRPWRYSAILSFLNPFIDARAAGTNGWALDPQPSHMVGCSTTTETRSDDDDAYGFAIADATTTTTTTSSSSSSDFVHRKRPSSAGFDSIRLKEAKMELDSGFVPADEDVDVDRDRDRDRNRDRDGVQTQQPSNNMKELFEMMMQSVTSLAATLASSHSSSSSSQPSDQTEPRTTSRLDQMKTEEQEGDSAELLEEEDEEEQEEEEEEQEEEEVSLRVSQRPTRAKRKSSDVLLEEFLRRMEAREVQRERDDLERRDDVRLFLLSLAPAMRRLTAAKQSWVRTRIQQLLHEAEFGSTTFQ